VPETPKPNEPLPAVAYSRKNPFPGKLLVNRRLNPGSEKDTRHFEISFAGSGLSYEVGDSMAVYPSNDPELVDDILAALGAKGDEIVPKNKEESTSLREALLRDYGITQTTPRLLKAIAERASAAPLLNELLDPERKQELDTFLWGMEVIDFLVDHPSVRFEPQEFVSLLPKLQPRLYSIASSLKAYPDSVHFIVDVITYASHGRKRKGVCSTFLADRCSDSPAPIFPTVSKFRLPEKSDAPIIMVGPGTGVAPFRAFLQERQATGARGKCWLFFGAQREKNDSAATEF
jgi:sulfite reductase (NADPH) flavoprotein alpha-component